MEYQKHVFTFSDWHEFKAGQDAFYNAANKVAKFIDGDTEGYSERMTEDQLEAHRNLHEMREAFASLKDLFYHAMWCDSTPTIDIADADAIMAEAHGRDNGHR